MTNITNMKSLAAVAKRGAADSISQCEKIHAAVDNYLEGRRKAKPHHLEPCKEEGHEGCNCSGAGGGSPVVDLVVLIDTSGSMSSKGEAISAVADAAVAEALKKCPTDLRLSWLGLGQAFPNTKFTQSYRDYLNALGVATDQLTGTGHSEEGADATADIASHFDWRPNACRAVFYISDEPLENGSPQNSADDAATLNAIAQANTNQVTVFTHLVGGTRFSTNAATIANFTDLAVQTGGKVTVGGLGKKEQYTTLLQDIICNACGGCKEVEWPDVHPCISVNWGDSNCDGLETDDVETLSLTVSNCYSNVTFADFEIGYLWVTDSNGKPVATLPDGTLSAQALPIGPICFGDIPPCKDGEASSVTREFVLLTRGAKPGGYKLQLGGVCYQLSRSVLDSACFEFELCAS